MNKELLKKKIKSNLNLKRKSVSEKFRDNVPEYVRVCALSFEKQCEYFGLASFRYYKGATVKYKESFRRKGGYFTYEDFEIKNALVAIEGETAYIRQYNLEAVSHSVITKQMRGKYLDFSGGKIITEKTYQKHYKILYESIKQNEIIFNKKQAEIRESKRIEEENKDRIAKELFQQEFDKIKVDEIWLKEKQIALQLYGMEKNDAFIFAFKGLLNRNGIEKVNYFYKLMKCL